MEARLKAQI